MNGPLPGIFFHAVHEESLTSVHLLWDVEDPSDLQYTLSWGFDTTVLNDVALQIAQIVNLSSIMCLKKRRDFPPTCRLFPYMHLAMMPLLDACRGNTELNFGIVSKRYPHIFNNLSCIATGACLSNHFPQCAFSPPSGTNGLSSKKQYSLTQQSCIKIPLGQFMLT